MQLSLAKRWRLPLFLHSRAAHTDFVKILREEGFGEDGGRGVGANGGVVHSFTGSIEEAAELVRGFAKNACQYCTSDTLLDSDGLSRWLERMLAKDSSKP